MKRRAQSKDRNTWTLFIVLAVIPLFVLSFLPVNDTGFAVRSAQSQSMLQKLVDYFGLMQKEAIPILETPTSFVLTSKNLVSSKPNIAFSSERNEYDIPIAKYYELDINEPIYAFAITGEITLQEPAGLVKVILVDEDGNEKLIYESYPLIVENNQFSFESICEETCDLDGIIPSSLKFELNGAIVKVNELSHLTTPQRIASSTQESQRDEQIQHKIDMINSKPISWLADKTSVSHFSYEEKKGLFGMDILPNLMGFEYYKGGVFVIPSSPVGSQEATNQRNEESSQISNQEKQGDIFNPTMTGYATKDSSSSLTMTGYATKDSSSSLTMTGYATKDSSSSLTESWDWRNVHGENWLTGVKDQGNVATCWAHGAVGALETQINLYYNQHLDTDLSEQMLVDCINLGPIVELSERIEVCFNENACFPGFIFCEMLYRGIADEVCDPYVERDITYNPSYCDEEHICNDWSNRMWKISDFHDYKYFNDWGAPNCPKQTMNLNEKEFKQVLIERGPSNSGIRSWNHAMVLVGYDDWGDWKIIEHCDPNEMCLPNYGCAPVSCDNLGEEMTICVNEKDHHVDNYPKLIPFKVTFVCGEFEGGSWILSHQELCRKNMLCVDNECKDESQFKLVPGHRECTTQKEGRFIEVSEYRPGEGEPYWIFKNSFGTDWGEDGYARIMVSLRDLGWASLPFGPFIPPEDKSYWPDGFTGEINCVDKDKDGYCNWGITKEMPSTCPKFCKPEKDCDDSISYLGPFDENYNCIEIEPPYFPFCIDTDRINYEDCEGYGKEWFQGFCINPGLKGTATDSLGYSREDYCQDAWKGGPPGIGGGAGEYGQDGIMDTVVEGYCSKPVEWKGVPSRAMQTHRMCSISTEICVDGACVPKSEGSEGGQPPSGAAPPGDEVPPPVW